MALFTAGETKAWTGPSLCMFAAEKMSVLKNPIDVKGPWLLN